MRRNIFAFYFSDRVFVCQLNGGEQTDNLLEMVCICVESFFMYLYLDICRKIFISLCKIFSVCSATVGLDVLSGDWGAVCSLYPILNNRLFPLKLICSYGNDVIRGGVFS